jgi:hypothetical protein
MFSSIHQQTSYNNGGFREFYRYDLATGANGTTQCVSCDPSGAPATNSAFAFGSADSLNLAGMPLRERRNMLPDGSAVFFVSPDRLVPEDTNGKYDVYMWRDDGRVKLISSGLDSSNSQFVDASADGQDVFFLTRERLVGTDGDGDVDIYDARDGGGLAAQNPGGPIPPCQGDDCKPPANNPPPGETPGTGSTGGGGNVSGSGAADCSALDAQANSLANKANQLSAKAKQASGKKKASLQKKAKKAKKKAKNARAQANQCKGQS